HETNIHRNEAIHSSEQIDADIKEAEKMRQAADAARVTRSGTSKEEQQAQENLIKGLRDLRKGQYERAIEAFQACLSLVPDHGRCTRNLRQAQKKFDEMIEAHMVLGRKYMDQGLYRQ